MATVTLAHAGQFFKFLRAGRKAQIISFLAPHTAGDKALFRA